MLSCWGNDHLLRQENKGDGQRNRCLSFLNKDLARLGGTGLKSQLLRRLKQKQHKFKVDLCYGEFKTSLCNLVRP